MGSDIFVGFKPGDKVVIRVPAGIGRNGQEWAERRGKVVMAFRSHLVLNGGGRHGTPLVATAENFVRYVKGKA